MKMNDRYVEFCSAQIERWKVVKSLLDLHNMSFAVDSQKNIIFIAGTKNSQANFQSSVFCKKMIDYYKIELAKELYCKKEPESLTKQQFAETNARKQPLGRY